MNKTIGFPGVALTAALVSCMAYTLQVESSEVLAVQNAPLTIPSDLPTENQRLDAISVETVHGDPAGKAPAFLKRKGCDFFVTGDLLYRKVKLDNLDFVSKVTQVFPDVPPGNSTTASMDETIYEPHFRWGWGFRVDAGFVFPHADDWEIDLIWTYLYDKAHQSVSAPLFQGLQANVPMTALYPSFNPPGLGGALISASGSWHFHFNTFDFEVARNYFVNKYISLRPIAGLRGAWIKQNYLVSYQVQPDSELPLLLPQSMEAKTTYRGLGPRLGIDLFWHTAKHFGIYGNLSGSLVYGQFKVTQDYIESITEAAESVFFEVKNKHDPWRVCPNIDSGVGVAWESFLDKKECYHLTMGVGYEIAYWFDFNQLQRFNGANFDLQEENGDLGMQGWNFHVRFDF